MKRITLPRKNPNNPQIESYVRAIERGMRSQHVVRSKDGWVVKRTESDRATKFFDSQKDAILEARKIAKNQKTELFIHGRNGRIRERNSYSVDSCPAKK